MTETLTSKSPEQTFELGQKIAGRLRSGDAVLLHGGLGAGKTLLTKGILAGLGFDADEVTSPSFTLVNIYPTDHFIVYHIDLWRSGDGNEAAFGVGLDEIVENENAIVVIEWAERLSGFRFPSRVIEILIEGSGDESRKIIVDSREPMVD